MRAWRYAALVLVLTLLGACAPTKSARVPLGVDVGWVVSNDGSILMTPAVAAHVAATGAGLARVEFRTGPFFSGDGPGQCVFTPAICGQRQQAGWQAFYAAYDRVVANLAAEHVAVLGLLDYTTVGGGQSLWCANNAEHGLGDGSNPYTAEFASTAEQVMAHYRGRIRYWEIWNEPNAWTHSSGDAYSGGSFLYPSNYAALLEATYRAAVTEHHLPVTIISGGLFGHSIGNVYSPQNAGASYLEQVFARWRAQGLKTYPLDAVGQHLYITQGGAVTAQQVQEYLGWVHQVAVSFGAGSLPTFVTEMGWTDHSVSRPLQAQDLGTALAAARGEPYVDSVVVFNLIGMGYGLYGSGFTPEPALATYQQAAKSWTVPLRAGQPLS